MAIAKLFALNANAKTSIWRMYINDNEINLFHPLNQI